MATDGKFGYHNRDTEAQDADDVDKDKCCTTIIARLIRETPYIAQTYR